MRSSRDIILILIVGVLFRLAYTSVYPCVHVTQDSQGYYNIGRQIFQTPKLTSIINPYRTPAYPVFLRLFMTTFSGCSKSAQMVGLTQTIMNLGGIIALYFLSFTVLKRRGLALGIAIIQVTAVNLITWERSLLTEGLAIPISIFLSALAIQTLKTPTWKRIFIVTVLSIVGILLRPSFIPYPIIIFLYIAYYHKTKPVLVRSCVALSFCIIFLFGYVKTNVIGYGYFGIQDIGDINVMGRIMQFQLPLSPAKYIHPLYEQVVAYKQTTRHPNVWTFINTYDIDVVSARGLTNIQNFNHAVIAKSPLPFLLNAVRDIPGSIIFLDNSYNLPSGGLISTILFISYFVFRASQYFCLLSIPLILIAWTRLLRKLSYDEAAVTLLGTLAYVQIFFSVMFGDGYDYPRFYSPIQPFLLLFIVWWGMKFIHYAKSL